MELYKETAFSALAFVIAVESIMRKHDPGGGVSVLVGLVSAGEAVARGNEAVRGLPPTGNYPPPDQST